MNINDLKASAKLENKAKHLERIFVGNKSACRPQHFVDFLQINVIAEMATHLAGSVEKIVLSGVMVSEGKVCHFEQSYQPGQLDDSIEHHQKIDYTTLHAGINALSYLVQKDLIGCLINTANPLFKDKAFVAWWNDQADDNEVIKPEEVTVEDKTAVIATAHVGEILHDMMIETLENYCKSNLVKYQKKISFEKSLCECESQG